MNIFFLHCDPKQSVKYYFNKHCVKIILEIAQMLYTAHWIINDSNEWWITKHTAELGLDPYRKTHVNHPTNKWVRHCRENYLYTCTMGLELCYEYTRRYGKIHKTQLRIEWLIHNAPTTFTHEDIQGYLATDGLPRHCTPIPLAMPGEYHHPDVVHAYRSYYIHDKEKIAQSPDVYNQLRHEWKI